MPKTKPPLTAAEHIAEAEKIAATDPRNTLIESHLRFAIAKSLAKLAGQDE